MTRLDRNAHVRAFPLGDGPAALPDQPIYEGADGVGQRTIDRVVGQLAVVAVRSRHRQGDDGGLTLGFGGARTALVRTKRLEGDILRLSAIRAPLHARRERRVDRRLNRRRAAKARRQVHELAPLFYQAPLGRLVERDVGAPEPVDGLLRITDDEELSSYRAGPAEVPLERVVRRQQQQNLGLQRVGVLELVDEEVGEATLELAPHAVVVADEITREDQQVEKV